MEQPSSYIGFANPSEIGELIDALIQDPPDIRWRIVRKLLRIEDRPTLAEIHHQLREHADRIWASLDWKVKSRLRMAMNSIQRPVRVRDYAVVKGKGAFTTSELEAVGYNVEKLDAIKSDFAFFPTVECHVHPKMPDLKFLSEQKKRMAIALDCHSLLYVYCFHSIC